MSTPSENNGLSYFKRFSENTKKHSLKKITEAIILALLFEPGLLPGSFFVMWQHTLSCWGTKCQPFCASVIRGRIWFEREFVTNCLTCKTGVICMLSAKMLSTVTGLVLSNVPFRDEETIKNKKNFLHLPLWYRFCNVNFCIEIMWMNWASIAAIRVSLEPQKKKKKTPPTSAHAHKRRQSGSRTGQTAGVKMVGDQNKHKPRHRLRCHRCRHRL